jgi:hypothetical protein
MTHLMIALMFLGYFSLNLNSMRKNQNEIMIYYQQFHQAVNRAEYDKAYSLMSPNYRQKYSVEEFEDDVSLLLSMGALTRIDSPYVADFIGDQAYIVADERTSLFYRPVEGIALELEKIDDEWYLIGNYSFYLAD